MIVKHDNRYHAVINGKSIGGFKTKALAVDAECTHRNNAAPAAPHVNPSWESHLDYIADNPAR